MLLLIPLSAVGFDRPGGLDTETTAPIVFVRGRELVTINADGSGMRTLTRLPGGYGIGGYVWAARHVTWSPDGRRIAFSASRGSRTYDDLFVVNADGSGRRRLTSSREDDINPAWSPDGKRIAFDRYDDGYNSIWVVNANGKGSARKLTPGTSDARSGRRMAGRSS